MSAKDRRRAPPTPRGDKQFRVILIKPSHYDDDGYVIRWHRSMMPSNSLASVYGLVKDASDRNVLGNMAIELTAMDETNSRVRIDEIIAEFRDKGVSGFVGLVGVQSNQYPRALDIARALRAGGVQVVIGGFHVSGLLSMFPDLMPELKQATDMGVTLFAGEAEGRMDELLRDAAVRQLKPLYNYIEDLPGLEGTVTPLLPHSHISRTLGNMTSFDAGRGCPFQCSFCTIINVQGRQSRRRSPDDIENILRQNLAQGVDRYFITDDNFARNKDWEAIFDRIIELRERERMDLKFIIQVDTLCHKIPNFIVKAARAGVTRVFIGLENINPANLLAAKKRQNKITEYRKMLLDWKNARVITYCGYILGFPADTPQSISEDIEIIKRDLPVDILEFFCLTPLPGSEDHKVLWQKGAWMDPDMNKYDLEHVVADHARMSREEWAAIYRSAWDAYYTPEHIETIMRRAAAAGMGLSRLAAVLFFFSTCLAVENVHPLQGGVLRLKYRRDRRPGLAVEPAWAFYPKYAWEVLTKHARILKHWLALDRMRRRLQRDPQRRVYSDQALMPVTEEESDTLELFTHNEAARVEVERIRKIAELTRPDRGAPQVQHG